MKTGKNGFLILALFFIFPVLFWGCPLDKGGTDDPSEEMKTIEEYPDLVPIKPLESNGLSEKELVQKYTGLTVKYNQILDTMKEMASRFREDRITLNEKIEGQEQVIEELKLEKKEVQEELRQVNDDARNQTLDLLKWGSLIAFLILLIRIGPSLIQAISPGGAISSAASTAISGAGGILSNGLSGILGYLKK